MRISNIRLGIGVPLDFHLVPSLFMDSFIAMDKPDWVYHRPHRTHGNLDEMRNDIVRAALEHGDTHLLMIDTDQFYERDTLTRLLSHRRDVVGARIRKRYPPFENIMFRGDLGGYSLVPKAECLSGELVEVDATGTGCVLFNMEVFQKIPPPWFEFTRGSNGRPIGEDVGFCAKLRAAGYRIYVDTAVFVVHLIQLGATDEWAEIYARVEETRRQMAQAQIKDSDNNGESQRRA